MTYFFVEFSRCNGQNTHVHFKTACPEDINPTVFPSVSTVAPSLAFGAFDLALRKFPGPVGRECRALRPSPIARPFGATPAMTRAMDCRLWPGVFVRAKWCENLSTETTQQGPLRGDGRSLFASTYVREPVLFPKPRPWNCRSYCDNFHFRIFLEIAKLTVYKIPLVTNCIKFGAIATPIFAKSRQKRLWNFERFCIFAFLTPQFKLISEV